MNRPATASQSLGNPERKNTPCISDLAGVKFLLKKERVFFFRGSALQVFGQYGGASIRTRQGETICLGEWIRPASALFPPAGGVWGGMRAGFGADCKIFRQES
jgi:hypothetical protein